MISPIATALDETDRPPHPFDATIAAYFDTDDPEMKRYLVNCADNDFRMQRFVAHYTASGGVCVTALLPSKEKNLTAFKAMFTSLRQGLFRKYEWPVFGMIDRYLPEVDRFPHDDGRKAAQLHAHLWIVIPEWVSLDDVFGPFSADLRKRWEAIHLRKTGKDLKNMGMEVLPPERGTRPFSDYTVKVFNRGPNPARWGRERNETYHLMANTPTLWQRDDIPSRRMTEENVIRRLKEKFGRVIGPSLAA